MQFYRLTLIIGFIISFNSLVCAQTFDWGNSIGGSGTERAWGLTIDSSGNTITTGQYTDSVDADPGPGTFSLFSEGYLRSYIRKLTPDNELVWAYNISSNSGTCAALASDADGNTFAVGSFQATPDFDHGQDSLVLSSNGLTDVFVLKIDPSGELIWAKSFGGIMDENPWSVTVDRWGNCFVTGSFMDTVDFDPGIGVTEDFSNGEIDVFVVKLNADGDFKWVRCIGGTLNETGRTVVTDLNGNVYTGGEFRGSVELNPNGGTLVHSVDETTDFFIQKLDSSGNYVWARFIGGASGELIQSLAIDHATSSVYATGSFAGTVNFNPMGTAIFLTSMDGYPDCFVWKLQQNGTVVWAKQFGDEFHDVGQSITSDQAGYIYVAGYFTGTVDFDPSSGVHNTSAQGNGVDSYIQKLNANGEFMWVETWGSGFSFDELNGVKVSQMGDVYGLGVFGASMDLDATADTNYLYSNGNMDVFQVKLNQTTFGVDEKEQAGFTVDSNPFEESFGIHFGSLMEQVDFSILDSKGTIVLTANCKSCTDYQFDARDLSQGIYFLQIHQNDTQQVIKLLKL
jgi:hypothetical protein